MSLDESKHQSDTASWLGVKKPGFIASLRGRFKARTLALLDGAYFGLNGQDIVNISSSGGLINLPAEEQKIVGVNPGVKMYSRLVSSAVSGSTLFAYVDGKGWTQMGHTEAQNEKLVTEVSYPEAVKYIGHQKTAAFISEILKNSERRKQVGDVFGISSEELLEVFSQPLYQVRSLGHERLIISDFEIDRPDPGPVRMQYRI